MDAKVLLSLTQTEWNDALRAMTALLGATKNQANTVLTDNVSKIDQIIFSKARKQAATTESSKNDIVTNLTDREFDTIMNEIKDEHDGNVMSRIRIFSQRNLCLQ